MRYADAPKGVSQVVFNLTRGYERQSGLRNYAGEIPTVKRRGAWDFKCLGGGTGLPSANQKNL